MTLYPFETGFLKKTSNGIFCMLDHKYYFLKFLFLHPKCLCFQNPYLMGHNDLGSFKLGSLCRVPVSPHDGYVKQCHSVTEVKHSF